eukprot:GHVS01084064.1.p1 GENE.GHVS01084064.1~~GHVS01084064.1.p1  ORF type:complete len:376 (-),score=41.21 GHVS01084064.1:549-1676(-)
MKALILVGGYGTRLRPLTLSVPKPLIDFCNKSIVEHQIAALVKSGVNHVILAVAYQPAAMLSALQRLEKKFGITITCSREEEPLGTAGPIALAREILLDAKDDTCDSFFVCNSDVICDFPYTEMLKNHDITGAEATILVTRVEKPSAYGVVVHDDNNLVLDFVEKPKEFVGDCINAGLYVLRKTILDRIQPRPTSIEKEIFPAIAKDKNLYCVKLDGYWADIGKPADFLHGMTLYLKALENSEDVGGENRKDQDVPKLSKGPHIVGNVLIDPTAKIGEGSVIGPNVTIGSGCVIGEGCRLSNSSLMSGVVLRDYCWLSETIVGWQSTIGKWVRIEGLTVVGEDVQIHNECYVNSALILPHKGISQSIHTGGTIIM